MQLVTQEDFRKFASEHKSVTIENVKVEIGKPFRLDSFAPPKDYSAEEFTVWSFPNRGDWATHSGKYRGNWSPYIPRNLILKYSKPGETVLDQMCGSGTTLVECKLLDRNGIGVDINRDATMLTLDRLRFDYNPLDSAQHFLLTVEDDSILRSVFFCSDQVALKRPLRRVHWKPENRISSSSYPWSMAEAKVTSGSHTGHTHYECDVCNQYFETANELREHGMKAHPQQVAATM